MQICIVGLGKVGLPIAVQVASKGFATIGADISQSVVEQVNQGLNPMDWEPRLAQELRAAVSTGLLRATTDITEAARSSDKIIIIVPVLLTPDRKADMRSMDAAVGAVARGLQKGSLVVVETTLPVGTTRGRIGPMLEEGSGLTAGNDFHLAFSPERVGSGRILHDLNAYPKVVGGIGPASTEVAAGFYASVLDAPVMPVGDAETAEFTKLAELVYRDVNIALANELALAAERAGVDIGEVVAAANSEPQSHIHQPGVGVGGHCVPVNPYFLIDGQGPISLASTARRINDSMASHAAAVIEEALAGLTGRTVLVLGVGYRPNVKEAANSPTFRLRDALEAAGASVLVHDPLFTQDEVEAMGLSYTSLEPPPAVEAIVLQAYHDEYRSLEWVAFESCKLVLDGRNVLDPGEIAASGLEYLAIGRSTAKNPQRTASSGPRAIPIAPRGG